jgi:hypothetical protein
MGSGNPAAFHFSLNAPQGDWACLAKVDTN